MDIIQNQILAPFTTFKIGGPAEHFCEAKTISDLKLAVKLAKINHWPVTILGKGSNILIPDKGLKGLVIKNSTAKIRLLPHQRVELDSGVFLPKAIMHLINHGLTGLEAFAGIPATVGGATAVAMHGVGHLWSEFVIKTTKYQGVILTVTVQLKPGDSEAARRLVKTIQLKKAHQPQQSSGCIFKNPPGQSSGAIIDQQLHLKGRQLGQAQISRRHANFIVNLGGAKSADVRQLIKLIQTQAKTKLNLNLEPEIIIYG
ncbi:MAG: FAD-binding protein [Patescibacteria group bacterium]